ncbi:MAG: glutamyl-tRNA reductase [Rhodospirillales bacterium]|nr:glutamyl-tRNA reductase [Rhodospirillales bacterium]MSP80495.1 glutamyl-tRNA reductase [Rhodospirillales bacterium]
MGDTFANACRYVVVGANHRSSGMALRDRLFIEERALPAFIASLRAGGIEQGIVLSTCDRIEVQAAHPDPAGAARVVLDLLAAHGAVGRAEMESQTYTLADEEAVRQVFAVAGSLDSLIVGEPEVLGQVKDAYALARELSFAGPEMDALMQAALSAAKRIRSETDIGRRPVSIAAAAVEVAREILGDLAPRAALVLGGGAMGEIMVREMQAAGLKTLAVIHPDPRRAEAAARIFGCHAHAFEPLAERLAGADVVLASLGARRHAIGVAAVREALRLRRRRPIFLVDAAVPGDIEPAVNDLDGAFLYTLDDLERVAMRGRSVRELEGVRARQVLEDEVGTFLKARAERAAVPALAQLRRAFEDARAQALADSGGDADKATRLLVNRLLHAPSEALRALAALDSPGSASSAKAGLDSPGSAGFAKVVRPNGPGLDMAAAERALRELFGIANGSSGKDEKP